MSNSNTIGPSSGTSIASRFSSGSLIAVNDCSSLIWLKLSISSEPLIFSPISSLKRDSTSLRGARPTRKPGTAAVLISSLYASSRYRSTSARETVTVTCRSQALGLAMSTFRSIRSGLSSPPSAESAAPSAGSSSSVSGASTSLAIMARGPERSGGKVKKLPTASSRAVEPRNALPGPIAAGRPLQPSC